MDLSTFITEARAWLDAHAERVTASAHAAETSVRHIVVIEKRRYERVICSTPAKEGEPSTSCEGRSLSGAGHAKAECKVTAA